ncbi:hypothetical protein EIP86_000570 [Pleurotus ostreatoroseus]|nr:hypothetical protein EIP86_000570 [Pleurotus ostreatoroseus]
MSEDKSQTSPEATTLSPRLTASLKRKRSASPEGVASPPAKRAIRRHGTLWFEDGNIAILAGDVYFRLHRGVLATHSEVFRDMLTLPPGISGTFEKMDGCPVVHLVDRASELAVFFEALYGAGKRTWYNPQISVKFSQARTILTLGMKYQVQHLVDEALHRLQRCFPSSLDLWSPNLYTNHLHPPLQINHRDAIATINLAQRFNIPSLLPAAFYTLASQLPKRICLSPVHYGPEGDEDSESLAPADIACLLTVIDTLIDGTKYTQDVIATSLTSSDCRYPDTCEELLDQLPSCFMAAHLPAGCDPLRNYDVEVEEFLTDIPGQFMHFPAPASQETEKRKL